MMHALLVEHPGSVSGKPLRFADVGDPTPGPGEILIQVHACAVCRTDLQIATGDLGPHRLPVIPGHQAVGEVAAVGPGVEDWTIGERAGTTWLASFDGTCQFCLTGRENLCRSAAFTGWDRDGGFADMLTVRADVAVRDPRRNRGCRRRASAMWRRDRVPRPAPQRESEPGDRLGLYGFGASARQAIQVARHWGCEIHVASRSPRDLDRAMALGATSVGGYDDPPPTPLDAAITFAPVGSVVVSGPAGPRPRWRGRRQRDPPRRDPSIQLRRPVVGALDPIRRERHPSRCAGVPRPRGRDRGRIRGGGPPDGCGQRGTSAGGRWLRGRRRGPRPRGDGRHLAGRHPGRSQRATTTVVFEWVATCSETLPWRARDRRPRPREPTTTMS